MSQEKFFQNLIRNGLPALTKIRQVRSQTRTERKHMQIAGT